MRYKDVVIISLLIILALIIRVYALGITDNAWGADPDERIRVAVRWLNVKEGRPLFPGDLWLPLHFYLIALTVKFFGNIPVAPRLTHLIIAVLTIIPFYKLVITVFDRKTAILSGILLVFYPVHILCSITTLSEGPFLFFMVIFLYLFFKYNESNDPRLFFASCFFFICATMIRYEAWPFIILAPLLLLIKKRRKMSFIFLCIVLFFPVLWISTAHDSYSNIMTMVNMTYAGVKYDSKNLLYWIMSTSEYLSWPFIALLVLGVLTSIKDKKKFYLALFPLFTLIFLSYGTFSYKIAKNIEFSLFPVSLLIPFAIASFLRLFNKKTLEKTLAFILLFFILHHMSIRTINTLNGCKYDTHIKEVAEYLKTHMAANTKVLLHNHDYKMNHIPVYAWKHIENFSISGRGGDTGLFFKEDIARYVVNERPGYMVYSDEASLKTLSIENGYFLDPSLGISAVPIFRAGPYIICDLRYENTKT
jgi:hypothetical protein